MTLTSAAPVEQVLGIKPGFHIALEQPYNTALTIAELQSSGLTVKIFLKLLLFSFPL